MANIRSAYAEVVTKTLDNPDVSVNLTVEKQQKKDGWQTNGADKTKIAGVVLNDIKSKDTTTIVYDPTSAELKIDDKEATTSFDSSSGGGGGDEVNP